VREKNSFELQGGFGWRVDPPGPGSEGKVTPPAEFSQEGALGLHAGIRAPTMQGSKESGGPGIISPDLHRDSTLSRRRQHGRQQRCAQMGKLSRSFPPSTQIIAQAQALEAGQSQDHGVEFVGIPELAQTRGDITPDFVKGHPGIEKPHLPGPARTAGGEVHELLRQPGAAFGGLLGGWSDGVINEQIRRVFAGQDGP
jgi:hypothetical protein